MANDFHGEGYSISKENNQEPAMIAASHNFPEFQKHFRAYLMETKRKIPDAINARMFYVMARATAITPMRDAINLVGYYKTQITTRIKLGRGKNAGRFVRAGRKTRQLERRHLIIQAIRAKAGLKGLYGDEMRIAAAKFLASRRNRVGYIKSVFIRAMKAFSIYQRFTQKNRASIGFDSMYGVNSLKKVNVRYDSKVVVSNVPATRQSTIAQVAAGFAVASSQSPKVNAIMRASVDRALADEGKELVNHMKAEFARTGRKYGAYVSTL